MGYGYNKGTYVGNVVNEPEAGVSKSGVRYLRFKIAVGRTYDRKNPNAADFFSIVLYDKKADRFNGVLHKGAHVFVVGSVEITKKEIEAGKMWVDAMIRTDYFSIAGGGSKEATPEEPAMEEDGLPY